MKFSWKNFPKMLLIHDPKSEILKKVWKNFPRNPLSDHPVFGNIFQDLAIWVNREWVVLCICHHMKNFYCALKALPRTVAIFQDK